MLNNIVELYGNHLKNKKIAFVVLGDINAYRAPLFITELRKYSCEVYPYITSDGLEYVTSEVLRWAADNDIITSNQAFDAAVLYPVTEAIMLGDHIVKDLIHNSNTQIIAILDKKISNNSLSALKDKNNITILDSSAGNEETFIKTNVSKIVRALSKSNLKNIDILVTAGPTPVKIDNVRRITNKFSGKLGIEIANELYLRGANIMLYQSYSGIRPPEYIKHVLFQDYEEYKRLCTTHCKDYQYGIFSAAVADYKPVKVAQGKIPSGGAMKSIELVQTEKVINLVHDINPNLKMISFKYEEGKNLDKLLEIADKRLRNGHLRVVANDLTLNDEEQKCFLCGIDDNDKTVVLKQSKGKANIARMIADDIENIIHKNLQFERR